MIQAMPMVFSQFISRISLRRDIIESFDNYPFSLPAVRMLDHLEMHPKITYVVGENGSGKSTLLEAIAVSIGFNAEGGSKNLNFGTNSTHSDLYRYLRVAKGFRKPRTGYFLRVESFYNVASEIDKLDAEPVSARDEVTDRRPVDGPGLLDPIEDHCREARGRIIDDHAHCRRPDAGRVQQRCDVGS